MSTSKRRVEQGKGAVELIEEAVHLLRLSPVGTFTSYYVGSLPFLLGLLYFWADMSRNAPDDRYCAAAASGLAVLFIWMKSWQAVFASRLKAQVTGESPSPWTFRRIINTIVVQTVIQPWGLPVLPMSLLIAFPFAWTYAFHQNISVLGNGETGNVRMICKRSWHQATLRPMQNHVLLSILSLFGFFVFLNVALGMLWLPQLLKTLLGIETLFTKSHWSMFNTTFLAAACSVTYLCMDPLMKAVYVLRCFYGDSLQSGADLRSELSLFPKTGTVVMVLLLLALACPGEAPGRAGPDPGSEKAVGRGVEAVELDHAVDETLRQREYRWRMPKERLTGEEENKGLLAAFVESVAETLKGWLKALLKWIKKIGDWLDDFIRELVEADVRDESSGTDWIPFLRGMVVLFLVLLTGILTVLLWRMRQRRRRQSIRPVDEGGAVVPNLADDEVAADALPPDRWLLLAEEMRKKGELRSALRAFYLAGLAYLAGHGRITIAGFKSNREYELELNRRAHGDPDLLSAFAQNGVLFDRVWYGMHPVTDEDFGLFMRNQERIRTCIES